MKRRTLLQLMGLAPAIATTTAVATPGAPQPPKVTIVDEVAVARDPMLEDKIAQHDERGRVRVYYGHNYVGIYSPAKSYTEGDITNKVGDGIYIMHNGKFCRFPVHIDEKACRITIFD